MSSSPEIVSPKQSMSKLSKFLARSKDISPAENLGNRPELTSMRLPLAIAVLVAHNTPSWEFGDWTVLSLWFVLSGFLITSILIREWRTSGRLSLVRFYARRALRLLPALYFVVIALYIYAAFVYVSDSVQRINGDVIAAVFYFMDYRQALGYEPFLGYLGQCWTLAVEEQFYLIWAPLLAVALWWKGRKAAVAFAIVGTIACTVDRESLWFITHSARRLYYAFDSRGDALFIGCILGILFSWGYLSSLSPRAKKILAGIAFVAFVQFASVLMFISSTQSAPYIWAMSATEISAAIIIAHLVVNPNGIWSRLLRWKPIVHLGTITYGLYLWHWPIYIILNQTALPYLNIWELFALRVFVTLACAEISWYLIERHCLKLRTSRFAARVQGTDRPFDPTVTTYAKTSA